MDFGALGAPLALDRRSFHSGFDTDVAKASHGLVRVGRVQRRGAATVPANVAAQRMWLVLLLRRGKGREARRRLRGADHGRFACVVGEGVVLLPQRAVVGGMVD
jgi:hypothetical protein